MRHHFGIYFYNINTADNFAGAYGFAVEISSTTTGTLRIWTNYGSAVDGETTTTVNDGNWHHIVLVKNNSSNTMKTYIDASEALSLAIGTSAQVGHPLVFGNYTNFPTYHYTGLLEQARTYNSVLTLSDITDIYNNSKPGSLPPLKTSSDLTTAEMSFPSGATTFALWDFNGDSVANPITYNGFDTSISYVNGKFGECAEFNGSSSTITYAGQIPSSVASDYSISFWAYPDTISTGGHCVFRNWYSGGSWVAGQSAIYFYEYLSIKRLRIYRVKTNGASDVAIYDSTIGIELNTWSHIVCVIDPTGAPTVYVNGINISMPFFTDTYFSNPVSNTAFGIGEGTTDYYDGKLDQVRIYSSTLTAQQAYDLWQKENDIQTHFTSGSTDTLVFKEGSGEITFKNDTPPGAEIGMLRYNSTLGQMEHFNSGGWKDFTKCTTSICNYPTTARCLYTFNGDIIDACGNTTPDYLTGISYTQGKFGQGFRALGPYSSLGYSRIGWSSGLGVDYNTSDFSISLWLKQYSYASYSACSNNALCYGYIFSGWSNSYWTLATDQQVAGNTIAWKSWGPGAGQIQTAESGIVDLNTWYHIVCTRSTTDGIQLWLNNQLVASVSGSWTAGTASVYDMIGGYGDTGYTRQGLNGSISQFRLFESVLTPAQISQLYNEVYCP